MGVSVWGASVQKPTNPILVFFDFLMTIDAYPKTTHYRVKILKKI